MAENDIKQHTVRLRPEEVERLDQLKHELQRDGQEVFTACLSWCHWLWVVQGLNEGRPGVRSTREGDDNE